MSLPDELKSIFARHNDWKRARLADQSFLRPLHRHKKLQFTPPNIRSLITHDSKTASVHRAAFKGPCAGAQLRSPSKCFAAVRADALEHVAVLDNPTTINPAKSSPISFNGDKTELWVVNQDSSTITVFSISSGTLTKSIELPVGKSPRSIAFGIGRMFVTCQDVSELWIFNASSHSLKRKIEVGHLPFGVCVAPLTGKIVVSNQGDNFRLRRIVHVDQALIAQRQKCFFVRRQDVILQIHSRQMALSATGWVG